jgi:hypothetical protein
MTGQTLECISIGPALGEFNIHEGAFYFRNGPLADCIVGFIRGATLPGTALLRPKSAASA